MRIWPTRSLFSATPRTLLAAQQRVDGRASGKRQGLFGSTDPARAPATRPTVLQKLFGQSSMFPEVARQIAAGRQVGRFGRAAPQTPDPGVTLGPPPSGAAFYPQLATLDPIAIPAAPPAPTGTLVPESPGAGLGARAAYLRRRRPRPVPAQEVP